MSSVLQRASRILDLLGAHPDEGFTIQRIARQVDLPPASCHRLLRDLVDLGWADQRCRRGDYRIGPRAFALTTAQPYRAQLMRHVQRPAQKLAESIGRPVLIATLRGSARHTLWEYLPDGLQSWDKSFQESDDLLTTSGGRLLLALAPRRRRDELIDQLSLARVRRQWRGILTRAELDKELQDIRRRRWVHIERGGGFMTMSAAFPDPERTRQWIAIGSYGPLEGWSEDQAMALRRTAAGLGPNRTSS